MRHPAEREDGLFQRPLSGSQSLSVLLKKLVAQVGHPVYGSVSMPLATLLSACRLQPGEATTAWRSPARGRTVLILSYFPHYSAHERDLIILKEI